MVVTSRQHAIEDLTRVWIDKHFPGVCLFWLLLKEEEEDVDRGLVVPMQRMTFHTCCQQASSVTFCSEITTASQARNGASCALDAGPVLVAFLPCVVLAQLVTFDTARVPACCVTGRSRTCAVTSALSESLTTHCGTRWSVRLSSRRCTCSGTTRGTRYGCPGRDEGRAERAAIPACTPLSCIALAIVSRATSRSHYRPTCCESRRGRSWCRSCWPTRRLCRARATVSGKPGDTCRALS